MTTTTTTTKPLRCALYARVSTLDQQTENQLADLRRYVAARGWTECVEYVDRGVSGAKDRRPALDTLVRDATRRRFDVLVCWRLDRLGRHLKHLITLLDDLQALGVAFVSLAEGIDATTPAGKLQLHILGAIAEFERGRIVERVKAGLARAKAHGTRLGRRPTRIASHDLERTAQLSVREAATLLGVPRSVLHRARQAVPQSSPTAMTLSPRLAPELSCGMTTRACPADSWFWDILRGVSGGAGLAGAARTADSPPFTKAARSQLIGRGHRYFPMWKYHGRVKVKM
jgi:DNA invertase Pin-like site-specific DNA recombinase